MNQLKGKGRRGIRSGSGGSNIGRGRGSQGENTVGVLLGGGLELVLWECPRGVVCVGVHERITLWSLYDGRVC